MSSLRSGLRAALQRPTVAGSSVIECHSFPLTASTPKTTTPKYTRSHGRPPLPSIRLLSRAASSSACHCWLPLRSSALTSSPRIPSRPTTPRSKNQPLLSYTHIHARTIFSSSVTVHYVDLPPDYDDAEGLPFRRGGDLTPEEVREVFGPGMSLLSANSLLRILHGRRVAGTLEDPAFRINTAQFPATEIERALAYLRKTTPVDEVINAGLRADDELAEMEREHAEWLARDQGEKGEAAETDKADENADEKAEGDKKQELSTTASKWQARLFRNTPKDDVYGVGALDVIRARNQVKSEIRERRRQEAEAARRAEQERLWAEQAEAAGQKGLSVPGDGRSGLPGVAREMSPRLKEYALAATSPLEAPPTMSHGQRLWPSYVFVFALVVGGSALTSFLESEGAASSTPAATTSESGNGFFSTLSPSAVTIFTLIGINIAVYALWRVPPLWRLFNRYMIVVPATPRPLSLVGAMFSHQQVKHLLPNIIFLWFIGMRLHDEIGRPAFLNIYFSSGLLAFLASLTNIVLRNNLHLTTLGASGAIYGIATAYFMMHKFEGFKILGLPPDPYTGIQGLGFIGLLLGLNILTLRAEQHVIDVVTHFAGMAVGAAFGEYLRVQKEEKATAAAEGRPPRSVWEATFASKPCVETPEESPVEEQQSQTQSQQVASTKP